MRPWLAQIVLSAIETLLKWRNLDKWKYIADIIKAWKRL